MSGNEKSAANEILFSENQKFRHLWIKFVIGVAVLGAILPVTMQITYGPSPSAAPGVVFLSTVFPIIILAGIVLLFYFLELRVRVALSGIIYKFHPFHRKWRQIVAEEIVSCENVTYRPLRDYGGWGIRYSRGNGTAYNVSGNRGIRIEKKNGRKVLFGTLRPDEFEAAVRKIVV